MNGANMAKWLAITFLVAVPAVLAMASLVPMPAYF